MPLISLDPDQADQAATRFATARDTIERDLQLMASANENVLATWRGQSSVRFSAQWQQQQQQIQNILSEIERLSRGLRIEAEEFRQADSVYGA
ncbi:WXG100 family type VII secretion target [Candidatus Viridilinea mediisalina]|nr:WXG100 family type VII secretion target [Candidatus Viridilinea mediisalina]